MTVSAKPIPLLRAHRHQWGAGLIHQIDLERDQTLCGKSPGGCPGTKFYGSAEQITCKSCLRSIESTRRSAETRARMAEEQEQWARENRERQRQWWDRYNAYLLTPTWRAKRERVLRRCAGLCEGCGERPAAHVHHLEYPSGLWPGSAEWIAHEKLFHLRALCKQCHEDVHR